MELTQRTRSKIYKHTRLSIAIAIRDFVRPVAGDEECRWRRVYADLAGGGHRSQSRLGTPNKGQVGDLGGPRANDGSKQWGRRGNENFKTTKVVHLELSASPHSRV